MIIDCHAHVYAWPKIKPYPQSTTLLSVNEQLQLMDRKGIDRAVILPLNNAESPMEFQSIGEILCICNQYPDRFIPFCNVDPRLAEVENATANQKFDFILEQYKDLGCKGFGELIAKLRWDDSRVEELLGACERVGLPVTFHTTTADSKNYGIIDDLGLPGLEAVLSKFPNLKFLGHSTAFWSEISGSLSREDKNTYSCNQVRKGGIIKHLLRTYPNLYGDLSANSGLNALTRDPIHAWQFIDEFQDKLLLGLDCCSTHCDMQHIKWLKGALKENKISEDVFQKIVWKNANKVLELNIIENL
ncbi:amidohydrolase family protein [Candidatus Peregrinibacteria bacterium]|nr:amidohydrolase family protein [Candidatus Peregrinibacteria bacterium]